MTRLPTHVLLGKVTRVLSHSAVEAEIQLGFGVSIRRVLILEGLRENNIPKHLQDDAKHCLVVLLGGHRVLIHTDSKRRGGTLLSRVYLDRKTHGKPAGMVVPFGLDEERLEISTFYLSLRQVDYDVKAVKLVLNGAGTREGQE